MQAISKGPIAFNIVNKRDANVVIENNTSGARAKNQSLKGWKIEKSFGGRVTTSIHLKDYDLFPNMKYTIWASGSKDKATADNEQIADAFSFGVGSCVWTLLDEAGNARATLVVKISGEMLR